MEGNGENFLREVYFISLPEKFLQKVTKNSL